MKLIQTNLLEEMLTSHTSKVKKKIFIKKGSIPKLITFGTATFKPGDSVEKHIHKTMYEVFYIQTGEIDFVINNKKINLSTGDCITIEPGELHSQHNNYKEKATFIYFSIATD